MDDYIFDEDEDLESGYIGNTDEDEDDEDDSESSEVEEDIDGSSKKVDISQYEGRMTQDEVKLSLAYDDIIGAVKHEKENAIEVAVASVVSCNPKHTSSATVSYIVMDLLQKQGHNRMVNSIFSPDTPLRGDDISSEFFDDDGFNINKEFERESRDQIARFIDYLANRDLSKDSIISRKRKQRHIPAFIIFLFSSGMYDLILDCPTMPKEYDDQIKFAFKKIMSKKYEIVEALANRYEELGRDKIAAKVRKLQLAWFNKEPAEIRTAAEYNDLDITYDDVLTYREFRSKFTNTSKAITQDVISDLIEVILDKKAGVSERLKDKTRFDAISDVKEVYKNWAKENKSDSELAGKIIWGKTKNN